jgi:hypothetical protein
MFGIALGHAKEEFIMTSYKNKVFRMIDEDKCHPLLQEGGDMALSSKTKEVLFSMLGTTSEIIIMISKLFHLFEFGSRKEDPFHLMNMLNLFF